MRTLAAICFSVATLAVVLLLTAGFRAEAASITWTNISGGYWSDTNNWSPHQIPTNTDNALITATGTYTVVFDLAGASWSPTSQLAPGPSGPEPKR